ncbi:MAG TPA: hypothetical protein VI111_09295 [Thermoleophilaceae bacterium]
MTVSSVDAGDEHSAGWVLFAGIMIFVVATLNIIDGIAAISNSSFFVGDTKLILDDLNTWGWILLIIGVIQLFVAFGIWSGGQWSRWLGVLIASLNAIAQMLFISAYPWWSLAILAIDILVIYGLAVHGGRGRASLT